MIETLNSSSDLVLQSQFIKPLGKQVTKKRDDILIGFYDRYAA